ncbi:MAG: AMP-binding protein [Deltaproteobacteria bacterium]|nr:AMP-binding protein [Deltaproteobacteria bacterium]
MEHNMTDYEETKETFKLQVPEYYNFGFDVVDKWAEDKTKLAAVWANVTGKSIRKYTFWDISRQSNQFANLLLNMGIKKGDIIFVMIPRIPEWFAVIIGANKIGAVVSPAPSILTTQDIEYRINQSEAKVVISSSSNASKVEKVMGKCPTVKNKIIIGGELDEWVSYDIEMEKCSPYLSKDEIEATKNDDPLLLAFSSGTTKYPRMVPHVQSYALAHILTAKFWHDLKPTDLHWTISDTGWLKAFWGKLYGQWQIGAAVFMHNAEGAFDPKITLRLLTTQGVTSFCAPPTAYRMLVLEDLKQYDFTSLKHCTSAGEPLNPEVIKIWKEATGLSIYDGYGQTESVVVVANYPCMAVKYGSMGKPLPGYDIHITDDDGNEMPVGEPGHIAIKVKPDYPIGLFKEYWKDRESTEEVFRGDWYFTGDKAYKDNDGYFWFYSRADDVIISSGYRIGPFEVESALQSHPAVAESAVVASPDPVRGDIVKAFITLAPGYEASDKLIKELQDHVKKETAPYKYPREIEFTNDLPKTISGKIKRVVLRKKEIEKKLGRDSKKTPLI